MTNEKPKPHSQPPQPRYLSAFHLSHRGEINKTVIITILTLVLLGLVLYLLLGKQFTGQATRTGAGDSQVEIIPMDNAINVNIQTTAHFGVVYFEMVLEKLCTEKDLDCEIPGCAGLNIESKTDWTADMRVQENRCEDKMDGAHIIFGDSTFNVPEDLRQNHALAIVTPALNTKKYLSGKLSPLNVYTEEGANIFGDVYPFELYFGCNAGATASCGIDQGVCSTGTQTCTDGRWGECLRADGSRATLRNEHDEICSDVQDNNCDGSVNEDCREICDNAVDDDGDGTIDAADPDCVINTPEMCDNSLDDDHDGFIDRTDTDCSCRSDTDCSDGKQCSNGQCIERMPETTTTCTDDTQCPTGKQCSNGQCIEKPSGSSPEPSPGRRHCESFWNCAPWSACNITRQQSRLCDDYSCNRDDRIEIQNCTYVPCQESWVCSQWSDCVDGQKIRKCQDLHSCGSIQYKPKLAASCGPLAIFEPEEEVRISAEIPVPVITPAQQPQQSFWDRYGMYLLLLLLLLLLALLFVLLTKLRKKPRQAYNLNELREWIKKEKAAGTSEPEIWQILREQTGWSDSETREAFGR